MTSIEIEMHRAKFPRKSLVIGFAFFLFSQTCFTFYDYTSTVPCSEGLTWPQEIAQELSSFSGRSYFPVIGNRRSCPQNIQHISHWIGDPSKVEQDRISIVTQDKCKTMYECAVDNFALHKIVATKFTDRKIMVIDMDSSPRNLLPSESVSAPIQADYFSLKCDDRGECAPTISAMLYNTGRNISVINGKKILPAYQLIGHVINGKGSGLTDNAYHHLRGKSLTGKFPSKNMERRRLLLSLLSSGVCIATDFVTATMSLLAALSGIEDRLVHAGISLGLFPRSDFNFYDSQDVTYSRSGSGISIQMAESGNILRIGTQSGQYIFGNGYYSFAAGIFLTSGYALICFVSITLFFIKRNLTTIRHHFRACIRNWKSILIAASYIFIISGKQSLENEPCLGYDHFSGESWNVDKSYQACRSVTSVLRHSQPANNCEILLRYRKIRTCPKTESVRQKTNIICSKKGCFWAPKEEHPNFYVRQIIIVAFLMGKSAQNVLCGAILALTDFNLPRHGEIMPSFRSNLDRLHLYTIQTAEQGFLNYSFRDVLFGIPKRTNSGKINRFLMETSALETLCNVTQIEYLTVMDKNKFEATPLDLQVMKNSGRNLTKLSNGIGSTWILRTKSLCDYDLYSNRTVLQKMRLLNDNENEEIRIFTMGMHRTRDEGDINFHALVLTYLVILYTYSLENRKSQFTIAPVLQIFYSILLFESRSTTWEFDIERRILPIASNYILRNNAKVAHILGKMLVEDTDSRIHVYGRNDLGVNVNCLLSAMFIAFITNELLSKLILSRPCLFDLNGKYGAQLRDTSTSKEPRTLTRTFLYLIGMQKNEGNLSCLDIEPHKKPPTRKKE